MFQGQKSNITKNVIEYANEAVKFGNSQNINLINNTIAHSDKAIVTNDKDNPASSGSIINNILYGNGDDLDIPENSFIIIYNISNLNNLKDSNNLKTDPKFVNPFNADYSLKPFSPAIDAGDQTVEVDPDGSRSDIGAVNYDHTQNDIIINEINYHSSDTFDPDDWVELYNRGNLKIDLSGWYIMDSKDDNKFVIPNGITLNKDSYLVLCRDVVKFKVAFPEVNNYTGSFAFGLSNSGDVLRLFNKNGVLIDIVQFDDKLPWDEKPDGEGPTLELVNPLTANNNIDSVWKASQGFGTPGKKNSVYDKNVSTPNVIFEDSDLSCRIFPLPANSFINIFVESKYQIYANIDIFDILGNKVLHISDGLLLDGENKYKADIKDFPDNIYILSINTLNGKNIFQKFIIVR